MQNFLRQGKVLGFFAVVTVIMFYLVMFKVNAEIDHHNGLNVLRLQLAFTLENADTIVREWEGLKAERFVNAMLYDYLYAFCYSFFFASLFAWLLHRRGLEDTNYRFGIGIAFTAGVLDWLENSVEILYITHHPSMNEMLFFIHSVAASVKWLSLPVVLVLYIMILLKRSFGEHADNEYNRSGESSQNPDTRF
ncbi:MAG: hypothetical protein PHO65_04020 [Sulfurovum sp.]|nr:hypothetical protein [Sulfurovum sp.]